MKLSQGFTRLGPAVLMAVFYGLSLSALTLALIKIHLCHLVGMRTALIASLGNPVV